MMTHDRVVKDGRKDLLIVILKEKINVEKLPPDLRAYISKFISFLLLYKLEKKISWIYILEITDLATVMATT